MAFDEIHSHPIASEMYAEYKSTAKKSHQMPRFKASEGQEIHDWSQYCEVLFYKLESTLADRRDIHHRTIRDYSQRFDLWVGFIGVFADGRESLDERLRFNPKMRDAILSMFSVLERNLSHEFWFESASKESMIHEAALGATSVTSTPLTADTALYAIQEAIDKLRRLAVHICMSPLATLPPINLSFAHRDPAGFEEFRNMATMFTLGRLPDIEVSLATQLISSISIRRFRFLSEGNNNEKHNARRGRADTASFRVEDETARQQGSTLLQRYLSRSNLLQAEATPSEPRLQGTYYTTEHSGSNFEEPQHHGSGSSDVPNTPTIPLVSQGYHYPHCPKPEKDDEYYPCSWCSDKIKVSDLDRPGWWRAHFKKDFQAYVCISEDCAKPPAYFSSFSRWRKHMEGAHTTEWARKIHTPKVWYCGITPHEYLKFENKEELENHFRREHAGLSAKQLERRLTRNTLPSWRKRHLCPICNQDISKIYELKQRIPYIMALPTAIEQEPRLSGRSSPVRFRDVKDLSSTDEEANNYTGTDIQLSLTAEEIEKMDSMKMARHISRHLKSLAFISIRYLEGDGSTDERDSGEAVPGDDCGDSQSSNRDGRNVERILNDFPEAVVGKLEFEDIPYAERRDIGEDEYPKKVKANIGREEAGKEERQIKRILLTSPDSKCFTP